MLEDALGQSPNEQRALLVEADRPMADGTPFVKVLDLVRQNKFQGPCFILSAEHPESVAGKKIQSLHPTAHCMQMRSPPQVAEAVLALVSS